MNYLAHACLSFNNPGLLTGNMISDFIKGKKQFDFPPGIRAGIQLHRAIDEFTDNHPVTAEVKKYFHPAYRLYAGAFADVVYDHFLANDTCEFPEPETLLAFTLETYEILDKHSAHFPEKFARMFPYMRTQNWLYHYRSDEGMRKSFGGLERRALYIAETDTAFGIFLEHKIAIRELYKLFYPDVKSFAARKAAQLLTE